MAREFNFSANREQSKTSLDSAEVQPKIEGRAFKDSGIEWIGQIPKEWRVCLTSMLFHEHKEKNSGLKETNLLSLSYGAIKRKDINTNEGLLPQSFETYNVIKKGDIIFRLTDLQNDKRSLRTGLCKENGIITSAYVTLRANKELNSAYFHYLFHSYDICKVFYGLGDGVRQGMNWEDVRKVMIFLPSLSEQQKIANFLDKVCGEVDEMVALQETMIEELKAYKQSVITEAVTKGLNPNAPMRNSGIDWIGEIPDEWNLISLQSLSESIRNGYVGPTRDLFKDEGVKYIQSLHLKDGTIDFDKHHYFVSEDWANKHPKIFKDDLLIVQTGDIGQVAVVTPEYDACNCHALIIVVLKSELCLPLYVSYYLRSSVGKELLLQCKTGALLPHLNSGKIGVTPITLPSLDEQRAIATYLDTKCSEIDSLIALKQAKIEELKEYKKSVIYEYVTGKKEVI